MPLPRSRPIPVPHSTNKLYVRKHKIKRLKARTLLIEIINKIQTKKQSNTNIL